MTERERELSAQVNRLIMMVNGLDFFITRFLDSGYGEAFTMGEAGGYGAFAGYQQVWAFANHADLDEIRDEKGDIIL